jgi:hypothetical protein
MSSSTPTSIQPGWYEDPQTAGMLRWFDGVTWSPFTKAQATVPRQAAVPQPRTTPSTGAPASDPSVAAARAALLAADSGPIPVVPAPAQASPVAALAAAAPQAAAGPMPVAQPGSTPAPVPAAAHPAAASIATVAPPPHVPAQRVPAAPQGTQSVAAAQPAPPAGTAVSSATTAATDRLAATLSSMTGTWPSTAGAPASADLPAWGPEAAAPAPAADRRPTALRRLVGRLTEDLPPWLPAAIAGPLSLRMVRYATRTDRFRDRLTVEGLTRLVFPDETAWQASLAACLGVLTIALSVWPLAGFGAWLVTSAFAGLAFRRLRREVLLGGAERAWFGIACGVGPLWTGLLALVFR